MDQLPAIVASILTTVALIGGGALAARRARKLGMGPEQLKLNDILDKVAKGWEERFDLLQSKYSDLETAFKGCKDRLVVVEKDNDTLNRTVARLASQFPDPGH